MGRDVSDAGGWTNGEGVEMYRMLGGWTNGEVVERAR